MFQRVIIIFTIFLICPCFVFANTSQDERRVEEQKRKSLRLSEVSSEKIRTDEVQSPQLNRTYFDALLTKKSTSYEDVVFVLMVLLGKSDQFQDFESQKKYIQEQQFLSEELLAQFNKTGQAKRGLTAFLFLRALNIKGGLVLRIFGTSQRYAVKELAYQGIMFSGGNKEIISGRELIIMLSQSAEFLSQKIKNEN